MLGDGLYSPRFVMSQPVIALRPVLIRDLCSDTSKEGCHTLLMATRVEEGPNDRVFEVLR